MLPFTATTAAEVERVEVTHKDGVYTVDFRVRLQAPRAHVTHYMDHPALWPQLSDVLLSISKVQPEETAHGLEHSSYDLRFETCVLLICRTIKKREYILVNAPGDVRTVALAKHSDFRSAQEHWRAHPGDERHGDTVVSFRSTLEPDFFIPPLFGPWLAKRAIRNELIESSQTLERLAKQRVTAEDE